MNKTLLSAAMIAGFGVVAFAPVTARASDGTITINGQITTATCTIQVNGGTASPTITLPTVQSSQFTASGTASGFTAVTIALSGCAAGSGTPAVTTVSPYFEQGPNTDLTSGYLKNATGTATNVEVMLSTTNATTGKVNLAAGSGTQYTGTAPTLASNPSFTYYAAYVSTAAAVTAGTVATSVQYDLNYH
jgi:major type 1 subunit fimbrin (pilin)